MQTEQDAIYSVCNKAKYTLIMERDLYCMLCKKWLGDEFRRTNLKLTMMLF